MPSACAANEDRAVLGKHCRVVGKGRLNDKKNGEAGEANGE
jgi:hypothetical protein